jgi:hypothetical protein
MHFAIEGKIYQGVFLFDTGLIGHCYLLSALTYVLDATAITK